MALPSSRRTIAQTTAFAAYYAAQAAQHYTLVPATLAVLYQQAGQIFAAYEILITQPAETINGTPVFPLVSPNDATLNAAITSAATAIAALNTAVQAITVAQAQAAAAALATTNQNLAEVFGLGAFVIGFRVADAATALATLQTHVEALLTEINAALAAPNDE